MPPISSYILKAKYRLTVASYLVFLSYYDSNYDIIANMIMLSLIIIYLSDTYYRKQKIPSGKPLGINSLCKIKLLQGIR